MSNGLSNPERLRRGIFLLICLLLIKEVFALPPLPSQFYGKVFINGMEAPVGANISAYDQDKVMCGFTNINEAGNYILSCKGDNLDTGIDEGAMPGDQITLHIGNVAANTSEAAIWKSGSFNEIKININHSTTSTISHSPTTDSSYLFYIIPILITIFLVIIVLVYL